MDAGKKEAIYYLIIKRYMDIINDKESHSISIIRQRVSPYNEFVRKIRDEMLSEIVAYDFKRDFARAAQTAVNRIREIETIDFSFNFWLEFPDIEKLKVATSFDKAVYLAALLRSLGSEDVKVFVTRGGKQYVRFSIGKDFLFSPESGTLFVGDDVSSVFEKDPPSYAFNDLSYEDFET